MAKPKFEDSHIEAIREAVGRVLQKAPALGVLSVTADDVIAELQRPAIEFSEGEVFALRYSVSCAWDYQRNCDDHPVAIGQNTRKLTQSEMSAETRELVAMVEVILRDDLLHGDDDDYLMRLYTAFHAAHPTE